MVIHESLLHLVREMLEGGQGSTAHSSVASVGGASVGAGAADDDGALARCEMLARFQEFRD